MKQFWPGACALAVLAACGDGNPFTGGATAPPTTAPVPGITIPSNVQGNVAGFTYDPTNQTLTVTALELDTDLVAGADSLNGVYTRQPALDRPGYEAYRIQDTPTERHVTAYVRQIDDTRAGIFVTGGQFETYFGGGLYSRDGDFEPATGKVQYGGHYVGLTNIRRNPPNDLDTITSPTPPPAALQPGQAAEVTGIILITADFVDNTVEGGVSDRVLGGTGEALESIFLESTEIAANGSFSGNVQQNLINRGNYGGIFGGTDSRVVAGSLFVQAHMGNYTNEEEHGLFVLVQCGTPGASPICP